MNDLEKKSITKIEKKELVFFYIVKEFSKFILYVLFVFIFMNISSCIINDLVIYNTGIFYNYNFKDLSTSVNRQEVKELLSVTAEDALNFIANFDGTINELQNILTAVKDAYENHGLSKEYYDSFMASFNTYLVVNAQDNAVITQLVQK
jgi:hypothetical protein